MITRRKGSPLKNCVVVYSSYSLWSEEDYQMICVQWSLVAVTDIDDAQHIPPDVPQCESVGHKRQHSETDLKCDVMGGRQCGRSEGSLWRHSSVGHWQTLRVGTQWSPKLSLYRNRYKTCVDCLQSQSSVCRQSILRLRPRLSHRSDELCLGPEYWPLVWPLVGHSLSSTSATLPSLCVNSFILCLCLCLNAIIPSLECSSTSCLAFCLRWALRFRKPGTVEKYHGEY